MVINIITSPAAFDSIQINSTMLIYVILIVLFLILSQFLLCRFSNKESIFGKKSISLLLFIIITEKIYYGISDTKGDTKLLQSIKTIPLYQPLTFSKLANRFGIHKDSLDENLIQKDLSLNYPLQKIELDRGKKSPNIFIFLFDAARASMINSQVAPNIISFSKDALVFKDHISGGDATRFGLFSFFYGLNASYWFNFLNANREPLLFEVLKKKEYQIGIFSSTDTRWPEFRKTIYCGILDKIRDIRDGNASFRDKKSYQNFKNFILNSNPNRPIFSFLFFDAPHAYQYPKEFEKFKPNAGNSGLNYLKVDKESAKRIKNSYKNAIYFDDHLFGEAIELLKERKLYKDSIIIFSSDHGQEFYEYGFFGHNSSFSKAQINSPFILKLPNSEHKIIKKMTSHLDVAPTLLKIVGVKNQSSDYSNGYDLLSSNYDRDYSYVAKWSKNAILTKSFTYIFSNLPNEIFKSEIRRSSDYKIVDREDAKAIDKIVLKVLEENRRFLK